MRRKMLAKSRSDFELVNKFSRIQNSVWIERSFDVAMQLAHDVTGRLWPPAFLGQTDPVFASNYAAPGQHLGEKIVECTLDFFAHCSVAIVTIGHDVDVNVAIPGVAKARDRKSI